MLIAITCSCHSVGFSVKPRNPWVSFLPAWGGLWYNSICLQLFEIFSFLSVEGRNRLLQYYWRKWGLQTNRFIKRRSFSLKKRIFFIYNGLPRFFYIYDLLSLICFFNFFVPKAILFLSFFFYLKPFYFHLFILFHSELNVFFLVNCRIIILFLSIFAFFKSYFPIIVTLFEYYLRLISLTIWNLDVFVGPVISEISRQSLHLKHLQLVPNHFPIHCQTKKTQESLNSCLYFLISSKKFSHLSSYTTYWRAPFFSTTSWNFYK